MARPGRPLVVTDPTLTIRRDNERLVMVRDRVTVLAMPLREVSHVALHGPVTVTGAALAGLLDEGIDVTLHSSSGRWRGSITSAQSGNVYLLLAQVDAWNRAPRRVEAVRALVAGKIAGQRQIVRRAWLDRSLVRCESAARRLGELEAQCWREDDLEALRGVEGVASAEYFGVFDDMLTEGWRFPGRVRRPPTDPVNAMLSFGYTLACGEVAKALFLRGFDTRIGLLHGLRYGRESLVLDMVEEFRASMVDRFVLKRFNLGQMKAEDFETHDDGAVRLTTSARRDFLEAWEKLLDERAPLLQSEAEWTEDPAVLSERIARPAEAAGGDDDDEDELDRSVRGEIPEAAREKGGRDERPVTWRMRIERQVLRLWRFFMKNEPYVPMTLTRRGVKAAIEGARAPTPDAAPTSGGPKVIRQRPPKR